MFIPKGPASEVSERLYPQPSTIGSVPDLIKANSNCSFAPKLSKEMGPAENVQTSGSYGTNNKDGKQFRARTLQILAFIFYAKVFFGGDVSAREIQASRCELLASTNLEILLDAPTAISEVTQVAPAGKEPSYCQVTGYVSPNIRYLLRLPTRNWNGKFLQLGCGGYCGTISGIAAATGDFSACINSIRRGYACVISDNGHSGSDGLWAYNNLQAEIDHAFRGAHVTALAAKAIAERYYSQPPKQSYFWGCSTGGRQALMEAQRFPWDFDGIIAGDPSIGVPETHMTFLWAARALKDQGGRSVFENADLDTLHRAVVAKCDLNDGVKDGLIGDPRRCVFDVSTLLCPADRRSDCLTAKQIEAALKIYSGPVTSKNVPIYTPIALKGSEKSWHIFEVGDRIAEMEFRYDGFQPNPGPAWTAANFDFDRDYKRIGIAKALYSATNPDLRQFKAAGGKMLSYVGWATHVPLAITDYYETVERTMGGRVATQDFFRLFAVPGMDHCTGGEGAFAVDWLGYLDAWVNDGIAPDKILGSHVNVATDEAAKLRFPLDRNKVEFTRPIYPYPTGTRYKGSGDPSKAENFEPENN